MTRLFKKRFLRLMGADDSAITAPTLIVHAKGDALQLFHNAEFAASTIPGAKLVSYDKGGHLLMVFEGDAIRPIVQKHILDHTE